MGLETGDLIGGLTEIELVDGSSAEKDGNQILVIEAKDMDGKKIDDIGCFGEKVIESVKEKGRKEDNKTILQVPKKNVTYGEKRINWISEPF